MQFPSANIFHIPGLLNGLLPCGMVYAALTLAATHACPLEGALFMFLFGLGTLPLMYAISLRGLYLNIPYVSPPGLSAGGSCCH